MIDVFVFVCLMILALVFLGLSFITRAKTVFLAISGVLFLFNGLLMLTNPLTSATLVIDCANASLPCTSSTITQDVSLPTPFGNALAMMTILFSVFLFYRTMIASSQEGQPQKKQWD